MSETTSLTQQQQDGSTFDKAAAPSTMTKIVVLGISFSVAILFVILVAAVIIASTWVRRAEHKYVLQGHRGCRGLMPENTIPAFLKAIDLNVNVLELDTCITKDNLVVISHDPWISNVFCYGPNGESIPDEHTAKELYKLYNMTYEEIRKCDCGSKGNPLFPDQVKMNVSKPLLADMIDASEKHMKEKGVQLSYNVEIKSRFQEGVFHPPVEQFVNMVYNVLKSKNILNRLIIQSFDVRALQVMRRVDANIPLSLLVEQGTKVPFAYMDKLDELGFLPDIYSPNYKLLNTTGLISFMHDRRVPIVPWTVNTAEEMRQIYVSGTQGLITDYPNIAVQLRSENAFQQ